jgi:flagellar brake protein
MFESTQPARLDDADDGDRWAPFRVANSAARTALLCELRDGSVPLSISEPGGATLRSCIWVVDTGSKRLSLNVDEKSPHLQQIVQSDEVVGTAYLASVKLQFELVHPILVRGKAACTLQADLPRQMYRFQRRTSFRVRPSRRNPPAARLRHPAIPDMQLRLRLLDVSMGGCALWLSDDVPMLQAGTVVSDVQIELDEQTRFGCSLLIQHVRTIGSVDKGVQLGCEWVALDGASQRTLQRWIDVAQKRTRLLSLT